MQQRARRLCEKMAEGQDKAFANEFDAEVCGKKALLYSHYDLQSPRKVMGIMDTGGTSHAHEHRLFFAAEGLSAEQIAAWWDYAKQVQQQKTRPDPAHAFTIVSLILLTDEFPPALVRSVKRLRCELQYGKEGWGSLRLAVFSLRQGGRVTNAAGRPLQALWDGKPINLTE